MLELRYQSVVTKNKYAENTSWPRWHTGHVAKKSWKWNRKWQLEFGESCALCERNNQNIIVVNFSENTHKNSGSLQK